MLLAGAAGAVILAAAAGMGLAVRGWSPCSAQHFSGRAGLARRAGLVDLVRALRAAGFAAAWKRKAGWLAAPLAAGIVSQQFTAYGIPTAQLFLTIVALATGLAEEPGATRPSAIFAAVVPFVVLALLYFAVRLTMADRELALTRQLLHFRYLTASSAEYDTYWFWRLPGASAELWYSRSWLEVARSTSEADVRTQALAISEEAAARATGHAEEPFAAWYNRAQISALRGDIEDTELSLRQAIDAHPHWFRPHWMRAQELLRQSRLDEAPKKPCRLPNWTPAIPQR